MYLERFLKVLDYIDAHLDEELSVERLSQVACLSKYHFHRWFSALLGVSVSAYMKQLRLKRASFQLAFRHKIKVIDIALTSGYESSEAFSRAFKQMFGQSPSDFRNKPNWISWHEKHQVLRDLRNFRKQQENHGFKVNITRFPELKVAVMEHRGPPNLLGDTIRSFIKWRKESKLPPDRSQTFNLLFDDPVTTDPNKYRFDLCASVTSDPPENSYGVITKLIPEGRCAVVRHIGSDDHIGLVVSYLYSDWLNQSVEELRDFPLFYERVNFFPDVPEHEMVTDVYLPLK